MDQLQEVRDTWIEKLRELLFLGNPCFFLFGGEEEVGFVTWGEVVS